MSDVKQKYPTVSSTELQRNFRDVLRRLNSEGALIVERDGVPAAALMPLKTLEKVAAEEEREERDRAERLRIFEEATRSFREAVKESGLTEDELLESLKEARQTVYERHYGKR